MTTSLDSASGAALLLIALLFLAPLAIAGVALINTGLGRSRSAAQSLLGSLATASFSAIAFAAVGASLSAWGGISVSIAGKSWNLFGSGPLLLRHFDSYSVESQAGVLLECLSLALANLIAWGAGADRLRIWAGGAIGGVLGLLVFPVAAHWAWRGGWLGQLGANFGLGRRFLDVGGAGIIHALGGATALAVIWVTGPRRGKFPKEELATAMPGHNAVYVLFGCLLAWVGWTAWNGAGALLWLHASPASLLPAALNTFLSAACSLTATLVVTRIRFGKPDASLCANGWQAGLVTSSATASLVSPAAAVFIGIVIGIAVPLMVELLELAVAIDDPSGAISVHLMGGFWGLFAAGVFASGKGQLVAQLVGIATLLGLFFPVTYLLLAAMNRVVAFRVEPDGERIGLDLHELGGSAYPEFVVHRDDSYR